MLYVFNNNDSNLQLSRGRSKGLVAYISFAQDGTSHLPLVLGPVGV